MRRRTFVKGSAGVATGLTVAGCLGGSDGGSGGDTTTNGDGDTDDGTTTDGSGSSETVVIGSDIPYPPFEYKSESGELKGFDVDIAKAVFEDQLGLDHKFQQTAFDTIIGSLN